MSALETQILLLLIPTFALASPLREGDDQIESLIQYAAEWSQFTVVFYFRRYDPSAQNYSSSKRYYANSAVWRMGVINNNIVSPARPALVNRVSNADKVFFFRKT